jgi:hypothetical protein
MEYHDENGHDTNLASKITRDAEKGQPKVWVRGCRCWNALPLPARTRRRPPTCSAGAVTHAWRGACCVCRWTARGA